MAQHLITKVTGFDIVGDHVLRVRFDDQSSQVINFLPALGGDLFSPLRDKCVFAQVRIDPECHTLVWPNGADFDPATLHDWPIHQQAFRNLVQSWEAAYTPQ